MLIILFGLSGAGKTYVGNILAKHFHCYFWDADQALPPIMQEHIEKKLSFTQTMRDSFIKDIIEKIKILKQEHPNLVIAQGLYKEVNRQQIHAVFPEAKWIYVKAKEDIIKQRLKERNNVVDTNYAHKIRSNFDTVQLSHEVLINNSDEDAIVTQIRMLAPPLGC